MASELRLLDYFDADFTALDDEKCLRPTTPSLRTTTTESVLAVGACVWRNTKGRKLEVVHLQKYCANANNAQDR